TCAPTVALLNVMLVGLAVTAQPPPPPPPPPVRNADTTPIERGDVLRSPVVIVAVMNRVGVWTGLKKGAGTCVTSDQSSVWPAALLGSTVLAVPDTLPMTPCASPTFWADVDPDGMAKPSFVEPLMFAVTLLAGSRKLAVPVTVVWPLLVTVVACVTLMSEFSAVVTWVLRIPCWPPLSMICASVGVVPCGFRKIWFWLNRLKFPLELSVIPDVPLPSLLNAMKLVISLFAKAPPCIDTPPPLLLVCGGGATRSTGGPVPRLF